jgi:hypothetical protein
MLATPRRLPPFAWKLFMLAVIGLFLAGLTIPAVQSAKEPNCGEFWKWKRAQQAIEQNLPADHRVP